MALNGQPLLLLRPTGRHPQGHTGGSLVDPSSEDYYRLETFVLRVTRGERCDATPGEGACTAAKPGPRLLRRLTPREFDRTVGDLLGIDANYGVAFAADTVVDGFDNNARALQMSALLADQMMAAAEKLATTALERLDSLLPCQPTGAADVACARQFIESFGARAFRRPLLDAEVERYAGLFADGASDGTFASGVELVLVAMLQSPHFLYRSELGNSAATGDFELSPWEIATELSYLIWGTMPDEELFRAAAAGELAAPAEIERQARRLLADPRSDSIIARFVEQWLDLDRLATVPKDATSYPEFDANLRAALRDEVVHFVGYVRRNGKNTLLELLTASYTLLSPELAGFYGLPAPATAGFSKVELAEGTRAGLLTLGGVLASHALPASSSPIHRGKLVRERLLCQVPSPPPPNLNATPPPVDPSRSTRERFVMHAAVEPCKSCHRLLDPIGFAFEGFDGIGRFRADDNGQPLDLSGEIVSTPRTNASFHGAAELGALLAASPDVHACFAEQWFRFGYALRRDEDSACTVRELAEKFSAQGLDLDALVVALTQSPHFVRRAPDTSPGDAPQATDAGTSTDAGSSDAAVSAPEAGSPPPPPEVTVSEQIDTQWATGWCSTVNVTNEQSTPVTWVVTLTIVGTLQTVWGATAESAGNETRFRGELWNAQLAPGATTSFGYCAER
jgi:hypothetical protein